MVIQATVQQGWAVWRELPILTVLGSFNPPFPVEHLFKPTLQLIWNPILPSSLQPRNYPLSIWQTSYLTWHISDCCLCACEHSFLCRILQPWDRINTNISRRAARRQLKQYVYQLPTNKQPIMAGYLRRKQGTAKQFQPYSKWLVPRSDFVLNTWMKSSIRFLSLIRSNIWMPRR